MSDFQDSVRSAWGSAWARGNVDALDAIMDPHYILEDAESGTSASSADL